MSSTFFQIFPEKPAAAVFLSGTGTNAAKLLEGWRSGAFSGWTPRVLVTDKPETSRARALAAQYGLPLVEHDIAKFYRERGLEKIALTSERALQVREEWTGALIRLRRLTIRGGDVDGNGTGGGIRFEGDAVRGTVTLPQGLTGTFEWRGKTRPLAPGRQEVKL